MVGIELEEAVALLLAAARPTERRETLPLLDALGRVLAEEFVAPFDQPPFDRSPLDGYALRAADSADATPQRPAVLRIVGEVCAGEVFAGAARPGEAVHVMTGAPIPDGCDCVIRQEWVETDGASLRVGQALRPHENYCDRGEDIAAGARLIPAGAVLTAAHIGVLAAMGRATVQVYARPTVALCSTGDELADVGALLMPGKIYNSNLYLLAARLRELGFAPRLSPGRLGDCAATVAAWVRAQADTADLVLTTGGVSVGKKDILHAAVAALDAPRLFWRVQMKPGTPVLAYRQAGTLCVGLSGNPYAALATFELLIRPVLAKCARDPRLMYRRTRACLADDFAKASPGRRFVRARLAGGQARLPGSNHSSGALFSAVGCNAMLDIPAGSGPLAAGTAVDVVRLWGGDEDERIDAF